MQQEWQPIETAPKDGRYVLLCYSRNVRLNNENSSVLKTFVRSGWYNDCYSAWAIDNSSVIPTHWMSLPEPPSCDCDKLILDKVILTGLYPYRKARIAEVDSIRVYPLDKTNLDQWLEQHSILIDNHTVYVFGDRALFRHDNNVYVAESEKVIMTKPYGW